jgi:hypothetical protein
MCGLDPSQVRKPLRGIGAFATVLVILVASCALIWRVLAG